MPLHPQLRSLVDMVAKFGIDGRAPHEIRAIMAKHQLPLDRTGLAAVYDIKVDGAEDALPARVYRPQGVGPDGPVIVFFHGGGFLFGSIDSHDAIARAMAVDIGCTLVSVGYRLAPEDKFPAGVEDCYAATLWVAAHADELGVDGSRLAVAGDSAGANFAAVVALLARERGGPSICFQLLAYPVTDLSFDYPSHREFGELGYVITSKDLRYYKDHYLEGDDVPDWRAAPIRAADLSGLPPAFIVTGEFDPLRDEGEAYGRRLQEAGVRTTILRGAGLIHGVLYGTTVDETLRIRKQIVATTRETLRI